MIRLALSALLLAVLPLGAHAQDQTHDRQVLGWGRMFDNDLFGDFKDRWHSGSYTVSVLQGDFWDGRLPQSFGNLLEYRFSGSTVTPANLARPAADDRRYVAPLSFGVHTHMDLRGLEATFGADLVAIGPQTGVGKFQSWIHGLLNAPKPNLRNQLGNAMFPTLTGEVGRQFAVSDSMTLRPFVSAQTGVETYVRAGGDIVIGTFGQGGLLLRDDTTGQRYRGIAGQTTSALSFTLGGDIAHVFDSALLPSGGAAVATENRSRLRAGVNWQGQRSSVFYGITYLSPEFDSQPQGQLVGSLNLNLRF